MIPEQEDVGSHVTTFDRYLVKRFFHVFIISFVATYGLYVVIDGFTNIDAFHDSDDENGVGSSLGRMAAYYFLQSVMFFALISPILSVISVMVVFALLLRQNEIYPILSAGTPIFRLMVPVLAGVVVINCLLIVDQELVIPHMALRLRAPRGNSQKDAQQVQPVYDFETHILISGQELFLGERKIGNVEFVLPVPEIAFDLTTLEASEAFYKEAADEQPSGWLLRDVTPRFDQLKLTEKGRKSILPRTSPNEMFVVTDVSFDQLHNRNTSNRFLSTAQLIRRIKNPSYSVLWIRGLKLHLHERLTQPLLHLITVLMAIPLIVRKESLSLIANTAICFVVLGAFFGLTQASLYLGKINLLSLDLAAWSPIIIGGSFAAWLSGNVQT